MSCSERSRLRARKRTRAHASLCLRAVRQPAVAHDELDIWIFVFIFPSIRNDSARRKVPGPFSHHLLYLLRLVSPVPGSQHLHESVFRAAWREGCRHHHVSHVDGLWVEIGDPAACRCATEHDWDVDDPFGLWCFSVESASLFGHHTLVTIRPCHDVFSSRGIESEDLVALALGGRFCVQNAMFKLMLRWAA